MCFTSFNKKKHYDKNPLYQLLIKLIKTLKKETFIEIYTLKIPLFKIKHHLMMRTIIKKLKANVYSYPHFDVSIFTGKIKTIFVIHDLLPLMISNYIQKKRFFKKLYFKTIMALSLNLNKTCICVSKATQKNVLLYFLKKKHLNG